MGRTGVTMRATTKFCAVCGAAFEGTGARSKYCPNCRKALHAKKSREYYAAHKGEDWIRERTRENNRKWYEAHRSDERYRAQIKANNQRWYAANREEILNKLAAKTGGKRRPEGGKDPEVRKRELKEYRHNYYVAHRGADAAKRKAEREAEKHQKED